MVAIQAFRTATQYLHYAGDLRDNCYATWPVKQLDVARKSLDIIMFHLWYHYCCPG
jgi:hypothetical protein